jgi:hypothetical protein
MEATAAFFNASINSKNKGKSQADTIEGLLLYPELEYECVAHQ